MPVRQGKFGLYLVAKWLDEIVAGTIPTNMALFTSDPQAAGNPLTVELVSPQYARVPVTGAWTRTGRLLTCTSVMLWPAIPPGAVITHIGAFDAGVNGNFLFSNPVPNTLGYYNFVGGGYLQIAAGAYHVGLDL